MSNRGPSAAKNEKIEKYMSDEEDTKIKGFDDLSSDEDEVVESRGFYSKLANTFKQFTGSKTLDA